MLKFREAIRSLSRLFAIDLAMDLGTANTLIYVKGEGIVVNEPSIIARDKRTATTLAIGRAALDYLGRGPSYIETDRPLKDGVIADFDAAMAMIQGFLGKIFKPRFWLNPRVVIGIPSGITQVEKRAVRDSAYQAGAKHILLIEEPMAAALGAGLDVEQPRGHMIVDIGGGTTEVAIISLAATVYCESVRVAGDEMDNAIVKFLQRVMHVEISLSLAEEVKRKIGCARPLPGEPTMSVTGKRVGSGGPHTVSLGSSLISRALEEPVDEILDAIRKALERVPPALMADVKGKGLMLTGGGSLLAGLGELIEDMTGIHANLADDPLTSVVHGCGIAIEDLDRWQRIFIA